MQDQNSRKGTGSHFQTQMTGASLQFLHPSPSIFPIDGCHMTLEPCTPCRLSCSARSRELKNLQLGLESARLPGSVSSTAQGVGISGKASQEFASPMVLSIFLKFTGMRRRE